MTERIMLVQEGLLESTLEEPTGKTFFWSEKESVCYLFTDHSHTCLIKLRTNKLSNTWRMDSEILFWKVHLRAKEWDPLVKT